MKVYPYGDSQKRFSTKVGHAIMKSYRFRIPKYDLPLRLRPWFLMFTCLVMIMLAFLGFTNFSHALPLNDKLLHFICFALATGVFYFIVDVEENARRIWFWRYFGLISTTFTCFLCGGILSEFVQAALPYKEFQIGDVAANILGSTTGLLISYYLEKYHRYRREIHRLYRPLDSDSLSDFEDDLDALSTQLLPVHNQQTQVPVGIGGIGAKVKEKKKGTVRFASVDDHREAPFEIGEDSADERDEYEGEDEDIASKPRREAIGQPQQLPKQAVLFRSP
ncbi:hypothetical protein Agabi119p4_1654 [Agaricus bisporus var. burnettii]|uniref:VanZ-like domain-containing protein n=1 Tax=Agaricus bisporus var. burnettii TaxID=192524 RepID=A0A8H7F7Q0_AGABI|nr:hypothetical protein AGABI2DRAFT_220940 [Agaricus bisporus var. bisporus H97]EKV47115.1 hypothetical protein AGABI2DRAFT_220940 [Agaricus bisporus var. bisporus H97]KAF7782278.1 hypothetical protein Agabi119p4_1654 [Agaricus bisporus var. burnettii]